MTSTFLYMMITIVAILVIIGLINISDLSDLLSSTKQELWSQIFIRVLAEPLKQKVGIFIDYVLLKPRLRTGANLKSRF